MNIKENLDRAGCFIAGIIVIIGLIGMWIFFSDPFQLEDVIFFGAWTLVIGIMAAGLLFYGVLGYVPIID